MTLHKLALVNCNLQEKSIETIAAWAMESKHLWELDLSYCRTSRQTWTTFFEQIKDIKTLRKLGLAGNFLIEINNESAKQQTLANIGSFIQRNPRIQHMDFTACGLFGDEIKEISHSVRRTGSL